MEYTKLVCSASVAFLALVEWSTTSHHREARTRRGADGSEMDMVDKGGSMPFLAVLNNTFLDKCVTFLLENQLTKIGLRVSVSCIAWCRPTVDISSVERF